MIVPALVIAAVGVVVIPAFTIAFYRGQNNSFALPLVNSSGI